MDRRGKTAETRALEFRIEPAKRAAESSSGIHQKRISGLTTRYENREICLFKLNNIAHPCVAILNWSSLFSARVIISQIRFSGRNVAGSHLGSYSSGTLISARVDVCSAFNAVRSMQWRSVIVLSISDRAVRKGVISDTMEWAINKENGLLHCISKMNAIQSCTV